MNSNIIDACSHPSMMYCESYLHQIYLNYIYSTFIHSYFHFNFKGFYPVSQSIRNFWLSIAVNDAQIFLCNLHSTLFSLLVVIIT